MAHCLLNCRCAGMGLWVSVLGAVTVGMVEVMVAMVVRVG